MVHPRVGAVAQEGEIREERAGEGAIVGPCIFLTPAFVLLSDISPTPIRIFQRGPTSLNSKSSSSSFLISRQQFISLDILDHLSPTSLPFYIVHPGYKQYLAQNKRSTMSQKNMKDTYIFEHIFHVNVFKSESSVSYFLSGLSPCFLYFLFYFIFLSEK